MDEHRYEQLIADEAEHWGEVRPDPTNPQIWDDERLFEIFFGPEYRELIRRVVSGAGPVLELGCGEGNLAIRLVQEGARVEALDLSETRLRRAREKAKALPHPPEFRQADLNTQTFPPSKYGCVVAAGSLHHIFNLHHLLGEVEKTLKRGGRLVVLDYVGMTPFRNLAAAAFYAVLPTYKPYREKWLLRNKLRSFLASEEQKRHGVDSHDEKILHPDSPFEGISQQSIISLIRSKLVVEEFYTFLPFFFFLAAKVRIPSSIRYPIARFLRKCEDFLSRTGIAQGAYVYIVAAKTGPPRSS